MQKYGVNELRRMFLEFFESKGHLAMKSFSLGGDAPEQACDDLSEVHPHRGYRQCRKDGAARHIF